MAEMKLQFIIDAQDKTRAAVKSAQGGMDKLQGKMKSMGPAFKKMALVGTVAFGAITAVIGLSIKKFSEFDSAMTKSVSIMGNITEDVLKKMKNVAREVAKTTTFTAKQAADAYFFLASAGLGANEAMAAMPKVAEFAQAGAFDLALATDLLTDAQSALGMTIRNDAVKNMENMVKVSDVLVKANTLANATVQQFSESLTTESAAALKSFGIDMEEGIAVLAAFADQGVKGQVAGSGLSRILRLLTRAANSNKEEMNALGISVFDGQGEIRNMADIVSDLENALGGMSDQERTAALETIGFTARVQGIILPLLGTSDAIRQYEKDLREAGGTTKEVADKQLESFEAQTLLLKSAIDDASMTLGAVFIPILLNLFEKISPILEKIAIWIEENPKLTKIIVIATAALAGLVAMLGTLGLILPGIITLFTTLAAVSLPITAIILAIIVVIGLFIAIGWTLYKDWNLIIEGFKIMFGEFGDKIINVFTKVKEFFASVWGEIKNIIGNAIDWLMKKIQPFISAFESVKAGVSWIGGAIGGVAGALGFQKGGIVPGALGQPIAAIVHGGERIIPAGAGIGGITINIMGGNYLSEDAAEMFGEELAYELKRNIKL